MQEKIEYTVRRRAGARGFRMSISSQGEVVVSAPPLAPKFFIDQFVQGNLAWILKTKAKLAHKKQPESDTHLELFGKQYTKQVISAGDKPTQVLIQDPDVIINTWGSKDGGAHRLENFYKQSAAVYITHRTQQLAEKMQTTYGRISLKTQKTRWGSCSSRGNLNFNWRLVHYPPEIIDYVIVHELAHRTHMNHSASFWRLVAEFDPRYQAHRNWLKKYGMTEG
jgi:predicted metal-dependent hydrolase